MKYSYFVVLCVLIVVSFYSTTTTAQQPKIGYFFPPAVQRGTSADVAIGGYDFTPDMQFFVYDEQIGFKQTGPLSKFHLTPPPYWFGPRQFANALPISREIAGRISIPVNESIGQRRWQVANANGASSMGVLLVTDIPEILEHRFNCEPQFVGPLPIGVSGRLSRITEKDVYEFKALKDGPITIDFWGRRLGSNLNAALQIEDSTGYLILDEVDTVGHDLTLTFPASKGETYTLFVHDTDFRGARQFIYRIALWDMPRVVRWRPLRLRAGHLQSVEFAGWGLASGQARMESITAEVAVIDDHTKTMRYRLPTKAGLSVPIYLPIHAKLVEDIHLDEFDTSPELKPNQAVTVQLSSNEETHEYRFLAKANHEYHVTAESIAVGSSLDVAVSICKSDGTTLFENDDAPGTTDAELDFRATEDGRYLIRVTSYAGTTRNSTQLYRLELVEQINQFDLSTNQVVLGKPGSKVEIEVNLASYGDFNQPVRLAVYGLPEGVRVEGNPTIETGEKKTKVILVVSEDVCVQATPVRIYGTVNTEEQIAQRKYPRAGSSRTTDTLVRPAVKQKEIRTPVFAPASGSLCDTTKPTTNQILFALTMDPPFALELIDKNRQRVVHRGTTYPAPFIVERQPEFHGEIRIVMKAQQSRHRMGINGTTVTVPTNESQTLYPCFMPEWISTARTSRMEVIAMGQVADPRGNLRTLTAPADAKITMILEGALLKVSHSATDLQVAPGQNFEVPIKILRNSKLQTVVTVDLLLPPELKGLVTYSPIRLDVGQTTASLAVKSIANEKLRGTFVIPICASTLQGGRWPVRSIVDFEIDFLDNASVTSKKVVAYGRSAGS